MTTLERHAKPKDAAKVWAAYLTLGLDPTMRKSPMGWRYCAGQPMTNGANPNGAWRVVSTLMSGPEVSEDGRRVRVQQTGLGLVDVEPDGLGIATIDFTVEVR